MKVIQHTTYRCDVCGSDYNTEADAFLCETRPVTRDKGVKVGDEVLITGGDCKGMRCKVDERFIVKKDWGHHMWERYWHTVGLSGSVVGSWGGRMLVFDQYELVP